MRVPAPNPMATPTQVLTYNTLSDPRFDSCVYKVLYDDGETLFYTVAYMQKQLETGMIKKRGT
jgi:hypothetical protein